MPFFKEAMLVKEADRQQLNLIAQTGNQALIDTITAGLFDDATTLLSGAHAQLEAMRMSVLATGKKDDIFGLLLDDEPFYINKMYPDSIDFYDYQVPGQTAGDLDFVNQPHTAWHYRWKVTASEPTFSFVGNSGQGLKYDFSVVFTTAEMPYGETEAKDITLSGGSFAYAGTAKLSQLEVPFVIEATSTGNQSGFYLEIGDNRFTYSQTGDINAGDVFKITGIETTKNLANVNARTNYAYFVIKPSPTKKVSYKTNFNGIIKILNFKELYK